MSATVYHPWLHRLAVVTACAALLLTIASGALVTTKDAGMAFADYPSSDGHNMLLYPWFRSAGAKFLEHGHRLAGVVIGLLSIALVVVAFVQEPRRWVKLLASGVLIAVIAQGLLGGQRVLLNERGLAFIHGSFAALVFALMATAATVTSRGWLNAGRTTNAPEPTSATSAACCSMTSFGICGGLKVLSLAACVVIYLQYVLGGLVRHRGMHLYEHVGFAALAAILGLLLAAGARRSRLPWLQRPAIALVLLIVVQLALGAGAWVTRFGFNGLGLDGYVPVHDSPLQVSVRTSHVLVGMLLFMTTVVTTIRIFRLSRTMFDAALVDLKNGSAALPPMESARPESTGPAFDHAADRPSRSFDRTSATAGFRTHPSSPQPVLSGVVPAALPVTVSPALTGGVR